MELTVTVMTFIIFVITLTAWALVGFIFWIPILTRATTVFSGMILYATLTHQNADILREHMRVASGFYADGFKITKEALYPTKGSPSPNAIEIHLGRFIIELLWTCAFWLTILWVSNPDLVRPLTVRIWSIAEGFQQLVTSFPFLFVLITIGVIFLYMWGYYLWRRFNDLSRSNRLYAKSAASIRAHVSPPADLGQSKEMLHKLDRIWLSLQGLSELLSGYRVMAAPSEATQRPPSTPLQPTAEKRGG
jgi:hypothetical protein